MSYQNFTYTQLGKLQGSVKRNKGLGEVTARRMIAHFQTCIHDKESAQEQVLDLMDELASTKLELRKLRVISNLRNQVGILNAAMEQESTE